MGEGPQGHYPNWGALNRLLGSPNDEPLCKGMQAALRHIDFFMVVHNLRSLAALGKRLTALTWLAAGIPLGRC
ncbi:MAG: hypothetical protein HYV08_15155 [Deltaproteobacteria bacterium]|nr:hypothetical protein [Deltaproteobacteria bacterium]